MKSMNQWLLMAGLAAAAVPAAAQDAAMLKIDDLVGVWNLAYESGETGTFTISKNDDGTAKIVVQTVQGGESTAKDVAINGDTITFGRDMNAAVQVGSVQYTAKLVDGKLEGSAVISMGGGGGAPGGAAPGGARAGGAPGGGGAGGGPSPFTATRAE